MSTPTLDSRFQSLRQTASGARNNNVQQVRNEKSLQERLQRLADLGDSESANPASLERESYSSSLQKGSSVSTAKSEWLNFNSKGDQRGNNRKANSSGKNLSILTEDDSQENIPKCFGCRQQGHVIRDCTECLNLTITSRNRDRELTKQGLRRTFSKYGNISSVRVNANSYSAFVCFSKREHGERLISAWENNVELDEMWDIEVYSGRKRMDCYNCGGNGHRASNCDRPTKRKNALKRDLYANEHQIPIPPDFFGQGSYTNGCERPTTGQSTDREDLSHKECDTAIPPNFFGQKTLTNETSHEHQMKDLQSQMQSQMHAKSNAKPNERI